MRLRTKLVIAAIIWFLLLIMSYAPLRHVPAPVPAATDLDKPLSRWYMDYNVRYFSGKLPKDTFLDWGESDDDDMGSTNHLTDGPFEISLNPKFCVSDWVARLILLHEDCHIIAWDESQKGGDLVHGPIWRSCMLDLDAQGAFRKILIDGYKGDK